MKNYVIFIVIVLISNIFQGITGFAGTVLAMPFSIFLVGINTAKPILNVLGLLSGTFICFISRKSINYKVFLKILLVMGIGLCAGMYISTLLNPESNFQFKILGTFILLTGLYGLIEIQRNKKIEIPKWILNIILLLAGVFHGMFVTGGPLLVIYLTRIIDDKTEFRATISFVWIFLSFFMMMGHINQGLFTVSTLQLLPFAIISMFAGLTIGNIFHKKLSQNLFLKISYILLIISGVILILK